MHHVKPQALKLAAETLEAKLERLEAERLALDEVLLDPFTLSAREKERAQHRYRELLDELSALYDLRSPPAAPCHVREGAVSVTAEAAGDDVLISSNTGLRVKLLTVGQGRIGHLVLLEPEDRCLLPWARYGTLRAAVRLAFEHLPVNALQLQTQLDLEPLSFQAVGRGWWLLSRDDYERLEHYVKPARVRQRRYLYFHPDWSDWVRYRRWVAYRGARFRKAYCWNSHKL